MPATGSLLGAGYFQKSEVDKVARLRHVEMVGGGEKKQQKMREEASPDVYTTQDRSTWRCQFCLHSHAESRPAFLPTCDGSLTSALRPHQEPGPAKNGRGWKLMSVLRPTAGQRK